LIGAELSPPEGPSALTKFSLHSNFNTPPQERSEVKKVRLEINAVLAPPPSMAPVKFEPWVERLRDGFLR
jgi:hypothetical protein